MTSVTARGPGYRARSACHTHSRALACHLDGGDVLAGLDAGPHRIADVTVSDEGPLIRLWVARSPMLADSSNSLLATLIGESVQVTDSGFSSLSDDQTTLHIRDLRTARELLADPALATAIRLHNARLVTMKNSREGEHIPELLDGVW